LIARSSGGRYVGRDGVASNLGEEDGSGWKIGERRGSRHPTIIDPPHG